MFKSFLTALVFFIITIGVCQAKYAGPVSDDPKIKQFFDNVHSPDGTYCCDESDGHPYFDGYTINPDGSVSLSNGSLIPKGKVVLGNPTGHPILWDNNRCFSPGTLT